MAIPHTYSTQPLHCLNQIIAAEQFANAMVQPAPLNIQTNAYSKFYQATLALMSLVGIGIVGAFLHYNEWIEITFNIILLWVGSLSFVVWLFTTEIKKIMLLAPS